jgi:hypothetical protein
MTTTQTVSQYVAANENRGELMVQEGYRVVEVNDPTVVEDAICDLLHLLASIHDVQWNSLGRGPHEIRRLVLSSLERAAGHWASEAIYAPQHPDESSDVLGGIPIYAVTVAGPYLTNH